MTTLPLSPPLCSALPPLPWPGALPMVSPTLARTLLLALLLHVWLVLLLGTAPGGTAQPGQGVGGTINVTLRGPEAPRVAEVAAPPPLPKGPSGVAQLPRWGSMVSEAAPAAPETPGAARLGEWGATVPPAPHAPAELPAPQAAVAVPLPIAPAPVALPAPRPPVEIPPPAERTMAEPMPAALPLSPALAPLAAAMPVPMALPAAASALAEPLSVMPAPPSVAVPRPVSALASAPAPVAAPVLAPLASPAALPEPELPTLSRPVPPAAPTVANLPPADRPLPDPNLPLSTSPVLPALGPNPVTPAALGAEGRPDAGAQVGQDIATPPAAAASVPPRLNLQLPRPRGGELSRFSAPGVLPLLPRPPELPDKLADDIAKSAKKDCRTAYQGTGLLAVVPLAAEALRKDSGCKW